MSNFTPEDLLLYHYKALNTNQQAEIFNELSSNWALREKYQVLKESIQRLDAMKLSSPREQAINNILNYAFQKTVLHK